MPTTEYAALYQEYWSRSDRWGSHSFTDAAALADQVLSTCGSGPVLDAGCGMGLLVRTLLRAGVDARGVDVAASVVDEGNRHAPGRFTRGSILALPFPDDAFDTVVCTDVLEHLAEADVPAALAELRRVARRAAFITLSTRADRDGTWHLTIRDRAWWESALFEAGWRKHPLTQQLLPYESLEHEEAQITIVLERIPAPAFAAYPVSLLHAQRTLHMDMLRESGRRSDAHIARYMLAARFVRPGDTVLDGACGLGYGAAILGAATTATRIIGLDNSPAAVEYARANFGTGPGGEGRVQFRVGDAADLSFLPDASVDAVVSMETLEHLPDPQRFLAEAQRVLTPAGRIIVSVPNDWTDQTGKDPNPHHLHVYDLARLRGELDGHFLIEAMFAQVAGGGMKLGDRPRSLRRLDAAHAGAPPEAEWWLMVGMKDPLPHAAVPYRETVFAPLPAAPGADDAPSNPIAFARDFDNPWLVRAMVAVGLRATDGALLRSLAERTLESARPGSADRGAAICVLAYRALEGDPIDPALVVAVLQQIDAYDSAADDTPHAWRWRISNRFAAALLHGAIGRHEESLVAFERCAELDPLKFSPLLATKTVEALLRAGELHGAAGRWDQARRAWERGLSETRRVLHGDWADIWGSIENPLSFGMHEVSQVADAGARCAAALRTLVQRAAAPGPAWQAVHHSTPADQARWAGRLEGARAWLAEQRRMWKHAAEDRQKVIEQLKSHIEALEKGRAWLTGQWKNWETIARNREKSIGELRAWIDQLQKAKEWHEQQTEQYKRLLKLAVPPARGGGGAGEKGGGGGESGRAAD